MKRPPECFLFYFFNSYLAVPQSTLGHYRGDSFTHPVLIATFPQFRPKGHRKPHTIILPYIGKISIHIKINLSKLCKQFCKEIFNVKLGLISFKINFFSYKDPIPDDLKSLLVYKFICASSISSYIGKTF